MCLLEVAANFDATGCIVEPAEASAKMREQEQSRPIQSECKYHK